MRVADACPGVLRPHRAADGALIRLRLPGGRISAGTLRRLAELAAAYGNGILQLTSRAGLQLRGLPDPLPAALVEELIAPQPAGLGLIPSVAHERVRNIACSPFTGLDGPTGDFMLLQGSGNSTDSPVNPIGDFGLLQNPGNTTRSPLKPGAESEATPGHPDLSPLIAELDAGLMADPALADLGGRFLFVLDDGRGDVIDLAFDLGFQATGLASGVILVGSADRRFSPVGSADRRFGPVELADAVPTLLHLARKFAAARQSSGAWHVRELPDWLETLDLQPYDPIRTPAAGSDLGRHGTAASVGVRLSRLSLAQARLVETITQETQTGATSTQAGAAGGVRLTPWRGLVLPDAADWLPDLEAAGFITENSSPWAQLSACVGAPHCAKSGFDTVAIAEELAAQAPHPAPDRNHTLPRTHIAGCGRRCGAPATAHLDWFGNQSGQATLDRAGN